MQHECLSRLFKILWLAIWSLIDMELTLLQQTAEAWIAIINISLVSAYIEIININQHQASVRGFYYLRCFTSSHTWRMWRDGVRRVDEQNVYRFLMSQRAQLYLPLQLITNVSQCAPVLAHQVSFPRGLFPDFNHSSQSSSQCLQIIRSSSTSTSRQCCKSDWQILWGGKLQSERVKPIRMR